MITVRTLTLHIRSGVGVTEFGVVYERRSRSGKKLTSRSALILQALVVIKIALRIIRDT